MFKTVTDAMMVSPQISSADVAVAAAMGVTVIINNRPDGESDDQAPGADIAAAAQAAGIHYISIPITQSGFSQPQVAAMVAALDVAEGGILAYCRSGTRSILLWSLAQAQMGADCDTIADLVANAGYDCAPVRPLMDMLRAQA
jgi:uncharacterized protein (TIGR01244 family)